MTTTFVPSTLSMVSLQPRQGQATPSYIMPYTVLV